MSWQILIVIYLVLGTISYLVRRDLAQALSKYNRLINGFFFVCVLYPIGLVTALITSPNLAVGWENFFVMLAVSGVYPLIMTSSFRASRSVDAGLYTILNNLTPIITITAATVLLNQSLNQQQMIGAMVIITSTFLVTLPRLRKHTNSNARGVMLALFSVTILGFAITYESWMLTRIDYGAYLVYGWGAQSLWMLLFAYPQRNHIKSLLKKGYKKEIMLYSFANAIKGLSFVAALKISGNASVVGATVSFLAVMVVLAAYFVLKEKEMLWLKISAAVLGSIGLLILNTS